MDLPACIKSIRLSLGCTQKELARALGVAFATVNRWENNRTAPAKTALAKLTELCRAHGLKLSVDGTEYRLSPLSLDLPSREDEERSSKQRATELFELELLDTFEVGTFRGLSQIHSYLFQDVFEFAGKLRTVNLSKGGFRFVPSLYLDAALKTIDLLPEDTFEHIVEKYVEMNVAHPFREGNGRAMRIWLDMMLKRSLGLVIDWSRVDKEDYLLAMGRSPIKDTEIKAVLRAALTARIDDREVFMKGIDASYRYEGYETYLIGEDA